MNELLQMIESVDPADKKRLDDIDLKVAMLLQNVSEKRRWMIENGHEFFVAPQYTRDRNALKAIRPEGWQFDVGESSWKINSDMGWHSRACKKADRFDDRIVLDQVAWFKTEELAELHAIIQAIEYERQS